MSESATNTIRITVNGNPRAVGCGTTISDLLASLEMKPVLLAVERNREIVRKSDFSTTPLADGDRIEIVTFVGGG